MQRPALVPGKQAEKEMQTDHYMAPGHEQQQALPEQKPVIAQNTSQ